MKGNFYAKIIKWKVYLILEFIQYPCFLGGGINFRCLFFHKSTLVSAVVEFLLMVMFISVF